MQFSPLCSIGSGRIRTVGQLVPSAFWQQHHRGARQSFAAAMNPATQSAQQLPPVGSQQQRGLQPMLSLQINQNQSLQPQRPLPNWQQPVPGTPNPSSSQPMMSPLQAGFQPGLNPQNITSPQMTPGASQPLQARFPSGPNQQQMPRPPNPGSPLTMQGGQHAQWQAPSIGTSGQQPRDNLWQPAQYPQSPKTFARQLPPTQDFLQQVSPDEGQGQSDWLNGWPEPPPEPTHSSLLSLIQKGMESAHKQLARVKSLQNDAEYVSLGLQQLRGRPQIEELEKTVSGLGGERLQLHKELEGLMPARGRGSQATIEELNKLRFAINQAKKQTARATNSTATALRRIADVSSLGTRLASLSAVDTVPDVETDPKFLKVPTASGCFCDADSQCSNRGKSFRWCVVSDADDCTLREAPERSDLFGLDHRISNTEGNNTFMWDYCGDPQRTDEDLPAHDGVQCFDRPDIIEKYEGQDLSVVPSSDRLTMEAMEKITREGHDPSEQCVRTESSGPFHVCPIQTQEGHTGLNWAKDHSWDYCTPRSHAPINESANDSGVKQSEGTRAGNEAENEAEDTSNENQEQEKNQPNSTTVTPAPQGLEPLQALMLAPSSLMIGAFLSNRNRVSNRRWKCGRKPRPRSFL